MQSKKSWFQAINSKKTFLIRECRAKHLASQQRVCQDGNLWKSDTKKWKLTPRQIWSYFNTWKYNKNSNRNDIGFLYWNDYKFLIYFLVLIVYDWIQAVLSQSFLLLSVSIFGACNIMLKFGKVFCVWILVGIS